MARSRFSRPLPAPAPDRQTGVRYALLHTLPGRLIVVGVAIRLAVGATGVVTSALPTFFNVVDTVAAIAVAIGTLYFVLRLFVAVKRRLLWRVRRKLILSYIFVGFIPALLILGFFLLCAYILFNNFSAYLVQSRLRALADRAQFYAQGTALEIQRAGGRDVPGIIARNQAAAAEEYASASLAAIPMERLCSAVGAGRATAAPPPVADAVSAGPWVHMDAPRALPPWIACPGFSGLLAYSHDTADHAHLLVRATAFSDPARPGYAVIVDLPVDEGVTERLRRETGVDLKRVSAPGDNPAVKPLSGRAAGELSQPQLQGQSGFFRDLNGLLLLEYRDWNSGQSATLQLVMQLSIAELYYKTSAAQGAAGQNFSRGLLLAVIVIGLLFLIIEFMALVAGLALAKSITGSVHELFIGTGRVRQGDFTHKIAVRSEDQFGELAESFNSMTASIEDLLRQAAEKKRLEEELRIAREIQMSLLPQGPLLMPGLSLTALCVPAREVGGDYYDFFPIDDHRLGILIADVSGKGTSAALYMAELKGLMLSLTRIHTSPRQLMMTANGIIAHNLDARSFITMTYAVIDLHDKTMTYARAGHTPLMYLPGPGGPGLRGIRILAPDGLVLGLKLDSGEMFERLLVEQTIPLNAGDLYVFFTDGISEAMNEDDDCFGEHRLARLVEEHSHLPSTELRERVLREIEAFVGAAPQHDDMTMILLKIDEAPAPDTNATAELVEIAEAR